MNNDLKIKFKDRKKLSSHHNIKKITNKIFWWGFLIIILISIIGGIIIYFTIGVVTPNGNEYSFTLVNEKIEETGLFGWITETILNIALGIITATLLLIYGIIDGFIEIIINALQDAIFILFSGQIIIEGFNLTYTQFINISLIIFSIMVIFYFIFTIFIRHNSPSKTILLFLKSLTILLIYPLLIFVLFGFFNWLGYLLNYSEFIDTSIYNMIYDYSFGLIENNNFSGIINFTLFCIGVVSVIFVFKWFLQFCIVLTIRVYEIIIFGILGLGFATSAMMVDEGKRLSFYHSVMITKITNTFLLLFGYLIVINVLPIINEGIINSSFNPNYSGENALKIVLIFIVSLSSFWLLKSLATEYAFLLSGNQNGLLVTQLNKIGMSSNMKVIPIKKWTMRSKNLALLTLTQGKNLLSRHNIKNNNLFYKNGHEQKFKNEKEWYDNWTKKINEYNSINSSAKNLDNLNKFNEHKNE